MEYSMRPRTRNQTMKLSSTYLASKTKLRNTKKRLIKSNMNKNNSTQRPRKCVCLPTNHSAIEFPAVWSELRQKRQLCDGVIRCNDQTEFYIHRIILSAVSPYFRALFTNSLNHDLPELTYLQVDAGSDLFSLILDYAYTGKCEITEENIESLLPLADMFNVLGMVQQCCNFLLNHMRPDNCLGILRFATHYFCTDLKQRGRQYVRFKFQEVFKENSEFLTLTFDEVHSILNDDELNVRHEEIVFEAARDWIEYDLTDRKQYVYKLMKCVRFGYIRYGYFNEIVSAWPHFNEDRKSQQLLQDISDVLKNLYSRTNLSNVLAHRIAQPRIPHEIVFVIGGWTSGSPTNFIETYDMRADRWLLSRDTDTTPRAYHGLVTLNGLIYMVGGFDGTRHFNSVRCFNPITHIWSEKACMYHTRCYVSVVVLDGKIYAMGGYNGQIRLNSVERYDPKANQWEMVAPMQKHRSDASAATLQNKIYIVGGFNGNEIFNSAEMYNPQTNQWTYIHSMINARSGVALVAFRDSLYAFGGFDGNDRLSTVEKYTPNISTKWTILNHEMISPKSNFSAVVLDNYIFIIGGFDGITTINRVDCYYVDTNEWFDASPMNMNRSALSACVIDSIPNIREYSFAGNKTGREGHANKCVSTCNTTIDSTLSLSIETNSDRES